MQHQAGFGLTGMEAIVAFMNWQKIGEPIHAAPEEARQHSHCWAACSQLTRRHLQQPNLTAMGVEQNEAMDSDRCKLGSYLAHQLQDQIGRQRESAGKSLMLWGETNGLRWESPNRKRWIQLLEHRINDPLGEHGVSGQRQLRPVLLASPEGPNHRGASLLGSSLSSGPGQLIEAMTVLIHGGRSGELQIQPQPVKMID